ncbi:hypothetical protein ACSVDA_11940 [Cytobacillus sp. Hm23]
MAVRIRKQSSISSVDHNELLNRGTRTHSEIDSYLSEIDTARGNETGLSKRFEKIEDKNNEQDANIADIEDKNKEQDDRLSDIDELNSLQDDKLTIFKRTLDEHGSEILSNSNKINDVEGTVREIVTTVTDHEYRINDLGEQADDLKERVTELELNGSDGGTGSTSTEVIEARTNKDGFTFSSLKERLDNEQGNGGGTSLTGYLYEIYKATGGESEVAINNGIYTVGKNEIEVFRSGIRQIRDIDYSEINSTKIEFNSLLNSSEVVVIRRRDRWGSILPLSLELEEHLVTLPDQISYQLSHDFNAPGRNLEVYYNGQLLNSGEEYSVDIDNKVTLLFSPVVGSLLLFQIIDKNKQPDRFLLEEIQRVEEGVDTYKLNDFDFTAGRNEVEVYVNGVKSYIGKGYIENNDNSITFLADLPEGGYLLFTKENDYGLAKIEQVKSIEGRVAVLEEGSGGSDVRQIEQSVDTASREQPFTSTFDISPSSRLDRLPVSVMEYLEGDSDIRNTVSESIKLTTSVDLGRMGVIDSFEEGNILSLTLDKTQYKAINKIRVR